ncbi:MAG: efflux transporter outer membrane subunit [Betaproteobacteria bacterium]
MSALRAMSSMQRLCVVGALVLALAGCMLGPDYSRPVSPAAPAYKELVDWKPAQPQDAIPRGKWWEIYADADLNALEEQVDISNFNLQAAAARVREADAVTQAARAALFPTLDLGFGATRAKSQIGSNSSGTARSINNSYNVALTAGWEIDLWGRIRRNIESSQASAQASVADLESARLSAQALLAQDYWLLRVADAEIALLDEAVAAYDRSLTLTQNQYSAGTVSRNDVVQALAQLKSAQAQALDAQVQRAQLEHAIALLVGKAPSELTIARTSPNWTFPVVPPGLPSQLLERRPDIASAERNVAAANAQIGVAEAAFFPALTLSGTGGFQSSSISRLLSLSNQYWAIGAAVAQSVFDAGLRSAQKDQAVAAYDATVATYRQTVLQGFQEVEDNLVALRILEQEALVQEEAVSAARQTVTITNNQYRAGITTYLAVVVVQNAALNGERTALAIRGRRLSASVGLIKALGGGWDASQLAQAPR